MSSIRINYIVFGLEKKKPIRETATWTTTDNSDNGQHSDDDGNASTLALASVEDVDDNEITETHTDRGALR